MKIAVRAPNWIGDGIMCLPALQKLRDSHPSAEITLICLPHMADVFRHIPMVDRIFTLPVGRNRLPFWQSVAELRREHFAMGVLFTNSFSSALHFRFARIHRTIGYRTDGRRLLLDRSFVPPRTYIHHARYYIHLIDSLTESHTGETFPFPRLTISQTEMERGEELIRELKLQSPARLIGLAPAAAYGSAKCWPPERFRELLTALHNRIPKAELLVFGSKAERGLSETILADLPFPVRNLAGAYSLRESLLILSRVDLMIANDSGLMHAAAALDRPVVALFGPTKPWQTAPLAEQATVIYHPIECAPCLYRECPLHHGCMKAISVEEVFAACERYLNMRER